MRRTRLEALTPARLRWWLAVFFVALAVPTAFLIHQAYSRLKWETFHQHRVLAEELARRIDTRAADLIAAEEARSSADYAFLTVAGDPASGFVQRSELSAFPVRSAIPGLIGFFQVGADGAFSTPLLPPPGSEPSMLGIDQQELQQRRALAARLRSILGRNRLVQAPRPATAAAAPAQEGGVAAGAAARSRTDTDRAQPSTALSEQAESEPQAAFDLLTSGRESEKKALRAPAQGAVSRVEDLGLDLKYQSKAAPAPAPEERAVRKERQALAQTRAAAEPEAATAGKPDVRIDIFESDVDPFDFALLDSGQFVLYRRVWRDGQRLIQGALIDQKTFLDGLVEAAFRGTALARMSELVVAYRGNVVAAFTGEAARGYTMDPEALRGALLYRAPLPAPLADLELVFSIAHLPAGPGAGLLAWTAAVLTIVLCAGLFAMYRLGLRQIALARQQQDFVSAVSHELKTPLTSIRMYGEMLREGWAADDRKKEYYDYIFQESERLSRLIANVLQLARMTRNELSIDSRPQSVGELIDAVRSKVATQIERAGFVLELDCEEQAARSVIRVDPDCFTQILINLIDNALKFSARADHRVLELRCRRRRESSVEIAVRDFGPGVAADQMKKVFRLFYRASNELTRETVGTGIGLALVSQLTQAMGGKVDVVNRDPGAEFRVMFPSVDAPGPAPSG